MNVSATRNVQSILGRVLRLEASSKKLQVDGGGVTKAGSRKLEAKSSPSDNHKTRIPSPTPSSKHQHHHIHFDTSVKVIDIPSRQEYPPQLRKVLWSNFDEIKLNAQRNRREFAAEGWDWHKVVEEDEMFFDKCSQERIHPVHLGVRCISDLR